MSTARLAGSAPQFVSILLLAEKLPAVSLQNRSDFASLTEIVARTGRKIATLAEIRPCVGFALSTGATTRPDRQKPRRGRF